MSIKLQKTLRFVPGLNFFVTMFSLQKVQRHSRYAKVTDNFKFVFVSFIAMLLVNIPQILVSKFVSNSTIQSVAWYISVYVSLFVLSSIAIVQQEKYIAMENEYQAKRRPSLLDQLAKEREAKEEGEKAPAEGVADTDVVTEGFIED